MSARWGNRSTRYIHIEINDKIGSSQKSNLTSRKHNTEHREGGCKKAKVTIRNIVYSIIKIHVEVRRCLRTSSPCILTHPHPSLRAHHHRRTVHTATPRFHSPDTPSRNRRAHRRARPSFPSSAHCTRSICSTSCGLVRRGMRRRALRTELRDHLRARDTWFALDAWIPAHRAVDGSRCTCASQTRTRTK